MKMLNDIGRISKFLGRSFSSNFENQVPPKRIFSGIQPTGNAHLGNYFGAIKRWVKLQDDNEELFISVVDLHSITLPQDPEVLRNGILNMTATLLACGIDPQKSILFQQSTVKQHAELCWILGTITTVPRLAHLPQYKEKRTQSKDEVLGLLIYPVLQTADILLYKSTHVPVGEDQGPQILVAQEIQKKFNKLFGYTFPRPISVVEVGTSSRLKSLTDPSIKMSKSAPKASSRIELIDTPDLILEKIKKALTDCKSEVSYEPKERPGVSNLVSIHSLFTGKSPEEICKEAENLTTHGYKVIVAEVVIESLRPIREKIIQYLDSPEHLVNVIKVGKEKASEVAERTMQEVRDKLGFSFRVEASKISQEKSAMQ